MYIWPPFIQQKLVWCIFPPNLYKLFLVLFLFNMQLAVESVCYHLFSATTGIHAGHGFNLICIFNN